MSDDDEIKPFPIAPAGTKVSVEMFQCGDTDEYGCDCSQVQVFFGERLLRKHVWEGTYDSRDRDYEGRDAVAAEWDAARKFYGIEDKS